MKLSNKKYYDISQALYTLAPSIRAKVVYDDNGVGTISAEAGAIPAEVDIDSEGLKLLKAKKIAETKVESGLRISAAYPAYKQRNIEREAIVSQALDGVKSMNASINNTRDKSKGLEATIVVSTLDQLGDINVTDDKHWA